ncbi:hypothetical protein A5648_15400 [Mycolicibacter sinensis]|uniref:Cytochrome P450 n=1 Tax=Mycolicibacter sinensis (strain JDM601) TaxID=875328 RepID=A0A1A3U844_MYCSD|nr:hypothetical protein A5648_15400 [Mycolicibacter sinensis]
MMRDPYTYLLKASQKYGDIFRIPVPVHDMVVINHPDLVREVYHDREATRYGLPEFPDIVKQKIGMGLPWLDGEEYTERRNLYTPMFGKRYLGTLADDFVDEMTKRLDSWDSFVNTGHEIDLQHEVGKILLPAFMRNMFSIELTDEQVHTYDQDLSMILAGFSSGSMFVRPPNILPLPGVPNVVGSFRRMLRTVSEILDSRASESVKRNDLLQILVDARLPDGSQLDRQSRITDATGLMVAGYDTVVAVLSWMFSLLPTNTSAQQRLYDEVDALGGDIPTAAHLNKLGWTKQCFDEAQRLQGGPAIPRWSKAENELAGFRIPKGTFIFASQTLQNRDPRWWVRPEVYDPHHFDSDQVAARPNTVFIPFGTGPHQCVGMAMAYQSGQLLTALILQRYRLHLRPGWAPKHKMAGATIVQGGVPCTVTRR